MIRSTVAATFGLQCLFAAAGAQEAAVDPDPQGGKRSVADEFRYRDLDNDGGLTTEEYVRPNLGTEWEAKARLEPGRYDRDRDGRLSLAEFTLTPAVEPGPAELLVALDADSDGSLDRGEFLRRYPEEEAYAARGAFYRSDADGNQRLSPEEFRRGGEGLKKSVLNEFRYRDLDDDGGLTTEEYVRPNLGTKWEAKARLEPGRYDRDRDGRLSLAEFTLTPAVEPGPAELLVAFDADSNGSLDEPEYVAAAAAHPEPARLEFQALDRDRDGRIGTEEFLAARSGKARFVELFAARDADGDGRLSREEYVGPNLGGVWEQAARRQAVAFDFDGDGHLDVREFAATPPGQAAPAVMLRLMDADGDDRVSREEYFARVPSGERPHSAAEFLRRDGNADGSLTLAEWSVLDEPAGSVPDPYVGIVRERVTMLGGLLREADADADGRVSRQEWPASRVPEIAPELQEAQFDVWDRNRDGAVPADEVEAVLEIAWGLRSPEGLPLRKQTGHVINASVFSDRDVDRDGDGRLTRAEFRSETRGDELFSRIDADGDGLMTLVEFAAAPQFSVDIAQEFVKLDTDFNGRLRPDELAANLPWWQAHVAKFLVPAFDGGDGELDFLEYRRTPPANPLLRWHRRPEDRDHDGALKPDEFHAQPIPALAGLRYEFFRRFDRDGNGSLSPQEYEFRVDYGKLQGEVAFKLKDRDGDGFLVFKDLFDEPRPGDNEPQRLQHYQKRLLRAEESFLAADADRDGRLSRVEFRSTQADTATAEAPRPQSPTEGRAGGTNWRLIAFLVLDGLVLLGVGAWFVRSSRSRP